MATTISEKPNFEKYGGDYGAFKRDKYQHSELNVQNLSAYWKSVLQDPVQRPVVNLERNDLWAVMQRRSHILFRIKSKNIPESELPKFQVNEQNKPMISSLANYALSVNDDQIDLAKGFMLRGMPGSGKTFLAKIFADANGGRHNGSMIKDLTTLRNEGWGDGVHFGLYGINNFHSCVTIHHAYRRDGEKSLDQYLQKKPLLFDDLGNEESTAMSYGNRINVMENIINARYDLFVNFGIRTFFTTNITSGEEITRIYGLRIRERLREMCNVWTVESNESNHISFRQ